MANIEQVNVGGTTYDIMVKNSVPIEKGGTNAESPQEARSNLGFTYGSAEPEGTPSTGEGSVYFKTGGDAIVEVGTDGMWTYKKYASGVAECWGSYSITVTEWKAWGNLYEGSPNTGEIAYPTGLFTSAPNFNAGVTGSVGAAGLETYVANTATQTPRFIVTRPSTVSSSPNFIIHIKAVGRWKV